MSEIIKVCKKHGELASHEVYPKDKKPNGDRYYGCLYCKRDNAKNYYQNNLESIKEKKVTYDKKRKSHPAFKDKKKKWMHSYQKNRRINRGDELRAKERIWKRNWVEKNYDKVKYQQADYKRNLRYGYVKAFLKNHFGFENPNDDLVFAKATLMMLKREIMKLNVANGKNKYVRKTKKYKRNHQSENAERIIIEGSTEDFKKWSHS